MEAVKTEMITSITEFRSDMQGTLKRAKRKPFAVLSNNKPSFYVVSPEQFELVAQILADLESAPKLKARMASSKVNAVSISLDEL